MDTERKKQVVLLARKARKAAEYIAKEEKSPTKLHGLCARASAILFELLREEGFNPFICFGNGHCFLEVDEFLVDITATQFGYSKIFIVHMNDLFSKLKLRDQEAALACNGYWDREPEHAYSSIREAIAHQDKHGWPYEQLISREDFI